MTLGRTLAVVVAVSPVVALTFCKSNDINSTTNNNESSLSTVQITPEGGEYLGPGGLLITVPPNAVTSTLSAQLGIITTGFQPIPSQDPQASPVYTLEPHGTTFLLPVTITLPYDATKVPGGDSPGILHAGTKTPSTAPWDAPIPGGIGPTVTVDGAQLQSVTVTTGSFSFYAVVASSELADAAVSAESGGDSGPSPGTDSSFPVPDSGGTCNASSSVASECFVASNLSCSNLGTSSCSCTVIDATNCGGCTFTYSCKPGDGGTSIESCTYPGLSMPATFGPVTCATICMNTSSVSVEVTGAGGQVCNF